MRRVAGDGVSFTIPSRTVVGVVGESGSGKFVTVRSIIKLLASLPVPDPRVRRERRASLHALQQQSR